MNRHSVTLALALLASALAAPAQAQVTSRPDRPPVVSEAARLQLRSFPLICRGSASLRTWVRPMRTGLLLFERSSGSAAAGLAPGQCAWRDRAVSAAEPTVVAHTIPEGADDEPPYLWPKVLYDPARYWQFQVYNDRKGSLVVTGSREIRP